jgi:hypothetical protein
MIFIKKAAGSDLLNGKSADNADSISFRILTRYLASWYHWRVVDMVHCEFQRHEHGQFSG